jgi:26S proteasome regulatory subunit T4
MTTLTIMRILPREVDPLVYHMATEDPGNVSYSDIGGLGDQIRQIREVIELPLINPGDGHCREKKHPSPEPLPGEHVATMREMNGWRRLRKIPTEPQQVLWQAADLCVSFFPRPDLFVRVGISPPKGVLLYGPPGTGKTLLARAIACNIEASFLKVVSSAIVDKYIGESARLIREMFGYAKEKQPCVIFMDEIDAIGGRRFSEGTSADREIQRTLMELLNQLDGFDVLNKVKIIMATNRPDVLDPALLRPGRLDRKVEISLPNEQGRLEVLKIHAAPITKHGDIDYEAVCKLADGFNAAVSSDPCPNHSLAQTPAPITPCIAHATPLCRATRCSILILSLPSAPPPLPFLLPQSPNQCMHRERVCLKKETAAFSRRISATCAAKRVCLRSALRGTMSLRRTL